MKDDEDGGWANVELQLKFERMLEVGSKSETTQRNWGPLELAHWVGEQ
jgi:hypothetical protein